MSGAADAFVFFGTGGRGDSGFGRGILGFVLLFSVCLVGVERSFGVCFVGVDRSFDVGC